MTSRAKMKVEESQMEIERLERDLRSLKSEQDSAVVELQSQMMNMAEQTTTVSVQPYKKDIRIDLFGVAWMPYHIVDDNGQLVEIPAFEI